MAAHGLSESAIRSIAKDVKAPWPKRAAANRILRTMEAGDIADFGALLCGDEEIEAVKSRGVNTEVVKKLKQRTRFVPIGNNGETEKIIEREIELFDRAGEDFDRVCDRTNGRPTQAVEMTGKDGGPIETKANVNYDAIEAELKDIGMAGGTQKNG